MTTQTVTNTVYGVVTNVANRTIVFPSGSQPMVYGCVLTNIADNKVSESYFHVDVVAGRTPLFYGLDSYRVQLKLNIYDFGKESTGSQRPMMLVDNILEGLRASLSIAEMGDGEFQPIGYTDNQEHFQYVYNVSFTTIN